MRVVFSGHHNLKPVKIKVEALCFFALLSLWAFYISIFRKNTNDKLVITRYRSQSLPIQALRCCTRLTLVKRHGGTQCDCNFHGHGTLKRQNYDVMQKCNVNCHTKICARHKYKS